MVIKKEAKKKKPKCKGTESSPVGSPRQRAFCGRMCGSRKKNTKSKGKKDPDSCINQSLRRWKCRCASPEDILDLITAGTFGNSFINESNPQKYTTKKSNIDIVYLVKAAMEGGDKERVKDLAMQAYKQITGGDPQKAVALLMEMFAVASSLTGNGIFSNDFEDFLTDEGMIEWVSEFVEERKEVLSDFDDQAFKMIAFSLHEIVSTNNFFNDDTGHIEVEE